MNDYFVCIKFRGVFSYEDSKSIKNYYDLVRCDIFKVCKKVELLTLWIREESVVDFFEKMFFILKTLTDVHNLTVIDCEVNKCE